MESQFRKNVLVAAVIALVYLIWRQRKRKLWNQEESSGNDIIKRVKGSVRNRVNIPEFKKGILKDYNWFLTL